MTLTILTIKVEGFSEGYLFVSRFNLTTIEIYCVKRLTSIKDSSYIKNV